MLCNIIVWLKVKAVCWETGTHGLTGAEFPWGNLATLQHYLFITTRVRSITIQCPRKVTLWRLKVTLWRLRYTYCRVVIHNILFVPDFRQDKVLVGEELHTSGQKKAAHSTEHTALTDQQFLHFQALWQPYHGLVGSRGSVPELTSSPSDKPSPSVSALQGSVP